MTDLTKVVIPGNNVIGTMFYVFSASRHPVAVRYVKYTKHFFGGYHHHDFPQVWYCVSGSYVHAVGDDEFNCGPGSVVIAPPGVFHSYEVSGEEPVELICLEGTFFFFDKMQVTGRINVIANMFCRQFSAELGFTTPTFVTLSSDEKSRSDEILLSLCENNFKTGVSNIKDVNKKIAEFFSLPPFALNEAQQKKAEHFIRNKLSPMMDAISYMNKNYAEKIHREDLIRISTLCQTEFFRLMKKITGTTYALYLQMVRLRRAQIMITFSTFSFSYIADKCGFGSRSYLGRLFKEYYGLTMHEERKNRNKLVKRYPTMIMTHEFWEKTNIE